MMINLALAATACRLALSQLTPNVPPPAPAFNFPPAHETVNIIKWEGSDLPKVYQRSDQLPLTDEELVKLSQEGFEPQDLVKMIEERRCACDASADGLIKLKRAGVKREVLNAISLHGLKPNRELTLAVLMDFVGESREARQGTFYFFIEDGKLTRVFTVNIGDLLSRNWVGESMVDRSDILLTKSVRRLPVVGRVPLKQYGKHRVIVAASANPSYTHPSQLSEAERLKAQAYEFDYPRASLMSLCTLTAGYRRDALLAHQWNFQGSRFNCEWD